MAQSYYIKITMEAGSDENDDFYQQTTFIQRYDDHVQQVEEQQPLFNAVAGVVAGQMTEAGNAYLNGKKPKPKGR